MLEITPALYLFSQDNVLTGLATQRDEAAQRVAQAAKRTILVVDDQQLIADTTALVLNGCGFRAVRAYNGHAALNMAIELKPDYVLTDIVMPGMNGVELAIEVRKHLPGTHIVLISGQAGITDLLRQAKDHGYEFDLLAKPIHPEKLVGHLKAMTPGFWT
jgi:CheY-like chemotaxis protein